MSKPIPWHNQACARCGVTAELHRSDPEGYSGGPMLPTDWEPHEFVFDQQLHDLATPLIGRLEERIETLEKKLAAL